MKLCSHQVIFGVKEEGFQIVSDFMLPFVILHNDSEGPARPNRLSFLVNGSKGLMFRRDLDETALASRFQAAAEEWKLYRPITWERTLGISETFPVESLAVRGTLNPGQRAVLHQEFFRVHGPRSGARGGSPAGLGRKNGRTDGEG